MINIFRFIPMKVLNQREDAGVYAGICPHCMNNIWNQTNEVNYCSVCGQAIKWRRLHNEEV